jgi:RimJ/RimL family protein N-acetyltransferase
VVGIVIREHSASIAVLEKLGLQFVENTEYMGFRIVKYVKRRP